MTNPRRGGRLNCCSITTAQFSWQKELLLSVSLSCRLIYLVYIGSRMAEGRASEADANEKQSVQENVPEKLTSDYYRTKNIPERFNHPGVLAT